MLRTLPLYLLLLTGLLAGCRKKELPMDKPGYFSIMQFTTDQWDTFSGQPYVLEKRVTLNGKTDTALVSALQVNWGEIFKIFFETEIDRPELADKYDFSMFEENATQSRVFSYTARDPGMFTQKLQITADVYNNKIRNIYIEAARNSFWRKQTRKLLYSPLRVIQIQEHTEPLIGTNKDLLIEYKF